MAEGQTLVKISKNEQKSRILCFVGQNFEVQQRFRVEILRGSYNGLICPILKYSKFKGLKFLSIEVATFSLNILIFSDIIL